MTKDDGFLRKVVKSPGKTATRLAYADWLEEQRDPRSAYLRAEAETFDLPRSGRRFSAAVKKLRQMSEKLDPLWVARVSRPPAGACCDRIDFVGNAPVLSAPALADLEQRLGLVFPVEYRAFLMNHNGGCPAPDTIVEGEDEGLFIEELYCAPRKEGKLADGVGDDLEECARRFWSLDPEFPEEDMNNKTIELARTLLPIGMANGSTLFLVHKGRRAGSVGICDVGDFELHEMRILARTFATFVAMITGSA